ncbi:MAG: hypothetical protein LBB45_03745 [Methanobrevibacter sp.]|jgi:hypothetical protein|nr:hypothetical protein [Candidatus Methanovirga basalitermitum]
MKSDAKYEGIEWSSEIKRTLDDHNIPAGGNGKVYFNTLFLGLYINY